MNFIILVITSAIKQYLPSALRAVTQETIILVIASGSEAIYILNILGFLRCRSQWQRRVARNDDKGSALNGVASL